MKNYKRIKTDIIDNKLRRFFSIGDAYRNFRKFAHKFMPIKAKTETGETIYYRSFRKPQYIGTLIKVSKHLAYRIVSGTLNDDTQEMIQIKLR